MRGTRLAEFQRSLLDEGMPLAWAIDVPHVHPAFIAAQVLGIAAARAAEAQ